MLARIVSALLGKVGFGFLDRVLGHLERRADSQTERMRIEAARQKAANAEAAGLIRHAMQFKVFWIPWLIAAVPWSLWFGWGVLDSLANGALPDVATLPPQLKSYADIVAGNIFYSGAGLAGAQMIASAVGGRR